jgi:hypothetical protein
MLTEEQLAALIDALSALETLIFRTSIIVTASNSPSGSRLAAVGESKAIVDLGTVTN